MSRRMKLFSGTVFAFAALALSAGAANANDCKEPGPHRQHNHGASNESKAAKKAETKKSLQNARRGAQNANKNNTRTPRTTRTARNRGSSSGGLYERRERSFSEVGGLEIETPAIEYRHGASSEYHKTKQPGMQKYSDINMKRPGPEDYEQMDVSTEYRIKEAVRRYEEQEREADNRARGDRR